MDEVFGRYIIGILMSVAIIVALLFAIMLGYSVKNRFDEIRLENELDQIRVKQQLDLKNY